MKLSAPSASLERTAARVESKGKGKGGTKGSFPPPQPNLSLSLSLLCARVDKKRTASAHRACLLRAGGHLCPACGQRLRKGARGSGPQRHGALCLYCCCACSLSLLPLRLRRDLG